MSQTPLPTVLIFERNIHNSGFLEKIYRQYYEQIYRFCYRMLGSHEPAQDIAQDTFLKMMDRLNHREEPIENPRAWLYKVAGNLCLNELSKNTLHRDREQVLEINRTENSTPEDRLIENEKQDRVRKEIAKLKPEQQMLIMMYNDGLSYREMAEATGIKEQSVGKTLWRIIDNLSRALKYDSSNPGK